jgi:hypothetical protein
MIQNKGWYFSVYSMMRMVYTIIYCYMQRQPNLCMNSDTHGISRRGPPKSVYTSIRMVYQIMAWGQDSRCAGGRRARRECEIVVLRVGGRVRARPSTSVPSLRGPLASGSAAGTHWPGQARPQACHRPADSDLRPGPARTSRFSGSEKLAIHNLFNFFPIDWTNDFKGPIAYLSSEHMANRLSYP